MRRDSVQRRQAGTDRFGPHLVNAYPDQFRSTPATAPRWVAEAEACAPVPGCMRTFHGSSFIAGPTGALLAKADRSIENIITATVNLDPSGERGRSWGTFRDRRPERYGAILTLDGRTGAARWLAARLALTPRRHPGGRWEHAWVLG